MYVEGVLLRISQVSIHMDFWSPRPVMVFCEFWNTVHVICVFLWDSGDRIQGWTWHYQKTVFLFPWHLPRFPQRQAPADLWRITEEIWNSERVKQHKGCFTCNATTVSLHSETHYFLRFAPPMHSLHWAKHGAVQACCPESTHTFSDCGTLWCMTI